MQSQGGVNDDLVVALAGRAGLVSLDVLLVCC